QSIHVGEDPVEVRRHDRFAFLARRERGISPDARRRVGVARALRAREAAVRVGIVVFDRLRHAAGAWSYDEHHGGLYLVGVAASFLLGDALLDAAQGGAE